jgi:hypothetical protein
MQAHRDRITIPEDRVITIRLPRDLPTGTAEVIVLTEELPEPPPAEVERALSFDERYPRDPDLGPIVFHEDPTAPVSEADWPSELRP